MNKQTDSLQGTAQTQKYDPRSQLPEDYDLRIVDAHHHFWDLDSGGHWPWLQDEYNSNFFLGDYSSICKNFLPYDYLEKTRGWNIIATVYCEAERSRNEQREEISDIERIASQFPGFPIAAAAHVGFIQSDRDEVLKDLVKSKLVTSIRSKPVTASNRFESVAGQPGSLQDPNFAKGLSKLIDFDLAWDLRVPYYHLGEAASLLNSLPNFPVIINHCGLPLDRSEEGLEIWNQGMSDLASRPNTFIKVSELGLANNVWDHDSNIEVVRQVLGHFGFDRSMFASNLPVSTLTAPNFEAILEVVLKGANAAAVDKGQDAASPAQLDDLFINTAVKAYKIDLESLSTYKK